MRLMIHRMAPRTIASFKYLVETGQPFKAKSSAANTRIGKLPLAIILSEDQHAKSA